ncbi:PREDICTED: uncharacterized protein LOC108365139 [Rhagoletis zephyria]|uniref:uncharacterized protein LOC108365139 n=1 Tax=Rhagoletis zephyria TaxID=28612 RepID=UPI0008114A9D|nr:PREDICTED: uncharacterized protein LOC108365139 [Rhagoletis zephyria]
MYEDDFALCGLMFTYICSLYRRLKDERHSSSQPVRPQPTRQYLTRSRKSKPKLGYFEIVFLQMKAKDNEDFFMSTRMNVSLFDSLLSLVGDELKRVVLPEEISTEERLAITLLHLAKGVSYQYLTQLHKLESEEAARDVVFKTCSVLWKVLQPIFVTEPTESEYKNIVKNFNTKWHVPNCVGAITSKKIVLIKARPNGESKYKNLVILATCDHNYVFTSITVVKNGEFEARSFGQKLMDNVLSLPELEVFDEDQVQFPYYFAGDLGLPLRKKLMRPYPGLAQNLQRRIFNYRLSRAHQVIENAFGILTARWQIFGKPINASSANGENIVLAAVALHNFVMLSDKTHLKAKLMYYPEKYADWEDGDHSIKEGRWRADMKNTLGSALLYSVCSLNTSSKSAFNQRDELAEYFEFEGSVEFQGEFVRKLIKENKNEGDRST